MTATVNTPRIQLTRSLYLLVFVVVVLSDGRILQGGASIIAQAAGFGLVVLAVLGRIWTTLFIAGRKEAQLVQDGPYAACRHPLYLCSIVAALGIGLTTRSLILTVALPFVIGVAARVAARREDAALEAAHGDAFRGYRKRVAAFWPRCSRMTTPESVTVPPRIYRKAFLDATAFLALWLLVLLAENLRDGGAWRALFQLP